jgi:hypothetical protein
MQSYHIIPIELWHMIFEIAAKEGTPTEFICSYTKKNTTKTQNRSGTCNKTWPIKSIAMGQS